jgi:hypothetical protein
VAARAVVRVESAGVAGEGEVSVILFYAQYGRPRARLVAITAYVGAYSM